MSEFSSAKLWVPAIFLLVLGFGNISVGSFKVEQYQQVLAELSSLPSAPKLSNASPLSRIQVADKVADRRYQRQKKAKARLEYYNLVIFGGQIFVGAGVLLFVFAAMSGLLRSSQSRSKPVAYSDIK